MPKVDIARSQMKRCFHFISAAGVHIAQMCIYCNYVLMELRTFVNIFLMFEGKVLSGRRARAAKRLVLLALRIIPELDLGISPRTRSTSTAHFTVTTHITRFTQTPATQCEKR